MTEDIQTAAIIVLALAVVVLARAVINLNKIVAKLLDEDGTIISASRVNALFFGKRPE